MLKRPVAAGAGAGAQRARYAPVAVWVIGVGQLMFVLDATIVNVALPHIQVAFGFSGSELEWLVSGYSLAFGGLLLLGGRTGDALGRRRVFVTGGAVFTVASLLGGCALTQWWLLAARALQGAGAAFASPSALALIATTFPGERERVRALGAYSAISTGGGAIGIFAGGLLTTYLSWRSIFFVNVPIGLSVAFLAPRVLVESERHPRRFDLLGAVTGTGAITLFVYALITGATGSDGVSHWTDPAVLACLAGGTLLLAGFVAVEATAAEPLVPLRLLVQRGRSGAYLIVMGTGTAMFGVFFFLTIFLQRVWDYSALETAALYIPPALLLTVGGPVAARLVPRFGRKTVVAGSLLMATIGMIGMSRIGESSGSVWWLIGWTYFGYAGLGMYGVPVVACALDGVPPGITGVASGIYSTFRQIGGATGLAVLGTIAWSVVAASITAADPGGSFGDPHTPVAVLRHALTAGTDRAFLTGAIVIAAALAISLLTITGGRIRDAGNPSPGPAERHPK